MKLTCLSLTRFSKRTNMLLVILFLMTSNISLAQLFTQSAAQTNAAGAGLGVPMLGTPAANVIFSSAGKVNGTFGAGNMPCTNGYSGFTTSGATVYSPSGPAIEITLSPANGFVLSASGVSAKMRYSATGPSGATFAYSINGGTTWINNGNMALPAVNCQSGTTFSWNFPCNVIVGFTQNFKFRIYFYNATGPTGTTQIENLTVNGSAIACSAPTAAISGTTSICGGGNTNITFTGTPSATVTYNVNGGANQTIALNCSGSAVLNTGALGATATYNLVSVGFGNCSQSVSGNAVVTVIPPISSAILSGTNSICSGSSANLSVAITGGVSPYTVVYTNGVSNFTINNYLSGSAISVSPLVNTTYSLVSVNSAGGCSSLSGTATITVSANPTAALLTGTNTICSGSSTNLSVAITGGTSPYTVTYFNGSSNTVVNNYISGSNIPVTPVGTTTYSLVSVTSAAGCSATGLSGTPVVTVRPTPTATISGSTIVCQNAASPLITFSNPQTLPITVTYDINGGAPATINVNASSTATVTAPTTTAGSIVYHLTSVVYQSLPVCSAAVSGQSATITVNGLFTAAVLSGSATICSGNNANLSVLITGGVSPYTITYFNGTANTTLSSYISGSAIPVSPTVNTNYSLVSVTGSGGCGGTGISGAANIMVSSPGTWLGVNTNWNDVQNWCDGNIPTAATDVIIPAGLSFYPVITTTDPKSKNMSISAGANINITAAGQFSFAGNVVNNGSITNNGTIVLNGTTGLQTFPGPGTLAPMNHLQVNNLAGVNLNKALNIGGVLTLTNGTFTVGANTLTINNPIAGTPNNLSANNISSITIQGSAPGVNLPASVSQLKNFTISNSSGTTIQGNLNIVTLLFITSTAGTVDVDTYTLNGAGGLNMSGGNLLLAKNGVVLPELAGTYNLTGGTVTFNGEGITASDAQTIRPVNYFNLSSSSTGDRILSSTGTIGVFNVFTPSTNLYTVTGSTVNFNKTNAQNIPEFTFYNLTLSGGNFTKTLIGDISIRGTLTFAVNTKLALVNKNVTLKSDASNTASVAPMPTVNAITYGTGRFIVERFIPVGLSHIKSWQLLSVPTTTGQSIRDAWQETATGGPTDNPNPGFGTQITSDLPGALALGFDFYTPAGSTMKTYNTLTNKWDGVSGTSLPIANPKGYMLFIRGDRSVTAYNQAAVPTIMRTKGKLFVPGADAPAPSSVTAGKLESVGNPYASAIDFLNLITTSTGIDTKYYVWDPLLPGSNGYGAYQTISSSNAYQPIPGGTANYPSGIPYTKIQSGQAFFVYSTPGGTVSFSESNKASGNQLVFRNGVNRVDADRKYIRAYLYTSTGNLADGNAVVFDQAFSNVYSSDDAIKLSNFGENFGIKDAGYTLAIDARQPLSITDTIFYVMENLRTQSYQLRIAPVNLSDLTLTAYLVDRFTGTNHLVSLTDSSFIDFAITTDPLSKDPGRFFIIFKPINTVPVLFTKVSATPKENHVIEVSWAVESETGIGHYEIERSNTQTGMQRVGSMPLHLISGTNQSYYFTDGNPLDGINFYRIKAIGTNGQLQYSQTVHAQLDKYSSTLEVYPNPVTGHQCWINLKGASKGSYTIQLLNQLGQVVYAKKIALLDNPNPVEIKLDTKIATGMYYLKIDNGFKTVYIQQVMIK